MRLLATGLLLTIGLAACQRQVPRPSVEAIQAEDGPDQETWGARYYISEEGLPRVHLRADYMAYHDVGDSTYMVFSGITDSVRVRADIFDQSGDSTAVLEATRFYFYDRERRLVAQGRVVATGREGRRVETEYLQWSEFERRVTTPGFARITLPDQRMQGYGLDADEEMTNIQLRRVTGTVTVEEGDS